MAQEKRSQAPEGQHSGQQRQKSPDRQTGQAGEPGLAPSGGEGWRPDESGSTVTTGLTGEDEAAAREGGERAQGRAS